MQQWSSFNFCLYSNKIANFRVRSSKNSMNNFSLLFCLGTMKFKCLKQIWNYKGSYQAIKVSNNYRDTCIQGNFIESIIFFSFGTDTYSFKHLAYYSGNHSLTGRLQSRHKCIAKWLESWPSEHETNVWVSVWSIC